MKTNIITALLIVCAFAFNCVAQNNRNNNSMNKTEVAFEQYTGYFEKNNAGLEGNNSYLAFTTENNFDKVFGTAATMEQNSFLPDNVFKSKLVVAAIKRGNLRKYENVKVTSGNEKLYVWYDAGDASPSSATYSSPLILAVKKGRYKTVIFMENGTQAGAVRLNK